MNSFQQLYEEQVTLLRLRGYIGPHSNLAEKELLSQLLYKFIDAHQKSNQNGDPSIFFIKTQYPHTDKKMMDVAFNYKYSPKEGQLSLYEVYINMKGVGTDLRVKENNELPSFKTAVKAAVHTYENSLVKKEHQFWREIENHKNLIKDKGFDQTGMNSTETVDKYISRLLEEMKMGLLRNIATIQFAFSFSVKTTGYFNNNSDSVEFEFKYSYSPDKVKLDLNKLSASLKEITLSYQASDDKDIPSARNIYDDLYENQRLVKEVIPFLQNTYCSQHKLALEGSHKPMTEAQREYRL